MASWWPDRVALAGRDWRPTFAELEDATNREAQAILEIGRRRRGPAPPPQPGRVALLMRHDAEVVAAALAVLKAGKAVVVINPADPAERVQAILRDAGPDLVITDAANGCRLAGLGTAGAPVTRFGENVKRYRPSPPRVCSHPSDLAWIVYTSGTTGRPKGVMQSHRNILHNAFRRAGGLGTRTDEAFALLASLSGGQGVGTAWWALLSGASLHPFPVVERGVTGLAGWLGDHAITSLVLSASVFRVFARTLKPGESFPAMRSVRLASEAAKPGDVEAFRRHFPPGCALFTAFSMSETGTLAQYQVPVHHDGLPDPLPVGRTPPGVEIELVDGSGSPVPDGQPGEVLVRGRYLSPGYWHRDDLTAAKFTDGGAPGPGVRCLRTGDRAVRAPDGTLTVLGRADSAVKIHGYRVETSHVEAALGQLPGVAAAAVVVAESEGIQTLTGIVAAETGTALDPHAFRPELARHLAGYMIPTRFVILDEIPLNAHGKTDRAALATMAAGCDAGTAGSRQRRRPQPLSATGEAVARAWSKAFRRDGIGAGDDFFALGGDSLTAALVAAEIFDATGTEVPLDAFLDHTTVAALAGWIDGHRGKPPGGSQPASSTRPPLRTAQRTGRSHAPLSFPQEHLWPNATNPDPHVARACTVARRHWVRGPLDPDAFQHAVDHIVRRHEILRTTFAGGGGGTHQRIHPEGKVAIARHDLAEAPDPERAARALLQAEAARPFDLEAGPLLRLALVRFAPDKFQLLRTNHHLISDGWSWKVFFGELGPLHEAFRNGGPPPEVLADPLRVQYGDFAAWQQEAFAPGSPAYQAEMDWWRGRLKRKLAPLELPLARDSPVEDADPADGTITRGLPEGLAARLDALCGETGATYFAVRIAAFAAQAAIETGQREFNISTHLTNRHLPELQRLFGYFSDNAVLEFHFDGDPTFRSWLATVRDELQNLQDHAAIPYARIHAELQREGCHPPPHRVFCSLSDRMPPGRFGDLEISDVTEPRTRMPFGFLLRFSRTDRTGVWIACDANRFDPDRVRSFLDRYTRLLDLAALEPDRPLAEVYQRVDARAAKLVPGHLPPGEETG